MQTLLSPDYVGATCELSDVRPGKLIELHFRHHHMQAIVIHPNGFGNGRPIIGVGFEEMSKHTQFPAQIFLDMIQEQSGVKHLEMPSGKRFRIFTLVVEDNKNVFAIEVLDWVELARDLLTDSTDFKAFNKFALIDFLIYFASEGIYAQAFTSLRQEYTFEDAENLRNLL